MTLKHYLPGFVKRWLARTWLGWTRVRMATLCSPLLARGLRRYYWLKGQADWGLRPAVWGSEAAPHFSDHRAGWFLFAFGEAAVDPAQYARAFYAAELIRPGDRVLDVGCGDGFFTKRFLSAEAAHVDALDIEPGAIAAGRRYQSAGNILYHQLDAVADPFPGGSYNVVVWDGAIGHFDPSAVPNVLAKIAAALTDDGVFVGSESLGREGHDHLQFFETADALRALLAARFRHVRLRTREYWINDRTLFRREAYWRCSNSESRLRSVEWA